MSTKPPQSLATVFCARLPPPTRGQVRATHALNALLHQVCDVAEQARPDAQVDRRGFAAHLAARLGGRVTPEGLATHRFLSDLYLAYACGVGDVAALRELERKVIARLGGSLSAVLPDEATRHEVICSLRERLLVREEGEPKILQYEARGPLSHWIRASVLREAIQRGRAQKRQPTQVDPSELSAALVDGLTPEVALLKGTYRTHFKAAFQKALASLEARDRKVLQLSVRQGMSLEELGARFERHGSNVGRWLGRLSEELQRRTREALAEDLGLPLKEVDSILRLLRSSLEVSLGAAEA